MTKTETKNLAALTARKVHLDDGTGHALCGATSMYHLVPTTRPANCAKCAKKQQG